MTGQPLLTDLERDVINRIGGLWDDITTIVGDGASRDHDLAEFIVHVHAIQQKVMAQAAARAYPDELRLLGGIIRTENP